MARSERVVGLRVRFGCDCADVDYATELREPERDRSAQPQRTGFNVGA